MYILLAILLLEMLIVLHEGGHFWAARWCGIEVKEFSVGMGPLLWQRQSKEGTLFSVRLLPVGGFCAFYGEDGEISDHRSFDLQAVWKRVLTVLNGPLMNFVVAFFAIVLYLSLMGIEILTPQVASVEENAEKSGLCVGDIIISINGKQAEDTQIISQMIADSAGEVVELTVDRAGNEVNLTIKPFYDEEADRWRVGFSFSQKRSRLSLAQSIPFSVQYNIESVKLILETLKNLVFRGQGVNEVTGPVGTVYAIQEITREGGLDVYMRLVALISANLAVMNLLPIPGLDGSRLLFLLVEVFRGKPVKRELEAMIHGIGFLLLMGLMVLLTYKDIALIVFGDK